MTDRVPMTKAGHAKLQEELDRLINVERRRIIKDIEEAREHGDLSENAEYHAAKERQGFIEGRVQEVQYKLGHANVVDPGAADTDRVTFGAILRLLNADTDQEFEYQIVGEDEAEVKNGKISFKSPVARALIGKEAGDEVKVRTPGGIKQLEILEIKRV